MRTEYCDLLLERDSITTFEYLLSGGEQDKDSLDVTEYLFSPEVLLDRRDSKLLLHLSQTSKVVSF